MDAHGILGGLSSIFAFAIGAIAAGEVIRGRMLGRRSALLSLWDGGMPDRASWTLRSGVRCMLPLARFLLRFGKIRRGAQEAVRKLAAKGIVSLPDALVSAVVALLLVWVVVASVLSGSVAFVITLPACMLLTASAWLKTNAEKRRVSLQESTPDTLRAMSSCFSSGLSLTQTFRQLSQSGSGPMRDLFDRAARVLEAGGTLEDALAVLEDSESAELAFVSAALDVQHQAGGPIAPVLEAASSAVEGELELARSLRVQTAQAKLSARIVTMMPFALVALFSLVSTDFIAPFFESFEGIVLLVMALTLQLAGVVSVRRMLRVEALA